jgi:hypothetical protein
VNNSVHNAQWPGQAAGYNHFVEDDFIEYPFTGNTNSYVGSIHDWYGTIGQCGGGWYCDTYNNWTSNFNNNQPAVPAGTDWTQYHTLGQLWIAGNTSNGFHGYVQYYFDGVGEHRHGDVGRWYWCATS